MLDKGISFLSIERTSAVSAAMMPEGKALIKLIFKICAAFFDKAADKIPITNTGS
ncbi:hypothetical protein ACFLZV_04065 [Candidatus Margulisiibacteriota bacterium]